MWFLTAITILTRTALILIVFALPFKRRQNSRKSKSNRELTPEQFLAELRLSFGYRHGDPISIKGQILAKEELRNVHNYEEALAVFERAIQLNPDDGELYMSKAKVLQALNRNQEAKLNYSKGDALFHLLILENQLQLTPDSIDLYARKAAALQTLGRYEEALATYEQAIQLAPWEAKLFAGKAATLQALHRDEEALATLATYEQDIEASKVVIDVIQENYESDNNAPTSAD
jgi:Flp pilus assembly protein TadD